MNNGIGYEMMPYQELFLLLVNFDAPRIEPDLFSRVVQTGHALFYA